MKVFLAVFTLTASIFFSSLGLFNATSATEDRSQVSILISPTQKRLVLEPDETRASEVTVTNSSTVSYEVKMYATPFAVTPDYSENIFDDKNLPRSQIYRWITFAGKNANEPFVLEPGEKKLVRFFIKVPKDVPAGGQYASIMAEIVPSSDTGAMKFVRRTASLLLTNIDNGKTVSKGEISKRSWWGLYVDGDVRTSLTIENLGNTDFLVESSLAITGLFGGEVDEVKEEPKIVFPETSRTIDLNWQGGVPFGIFRLTQKTKFLGETIEETKIVITISGWLLILIIVITTALIVWLAIKIKRKRDAKERRRVIIFPDPSKVNKKKWWRRN